MSELTREERESLAAGWPDFWKCHAAATAIVTAREQAAEARGRAAGAEALASVIDLLIDSTSPGGRVGYWKSVTWSIQDWWRFHAALLEAVDAREDVRNGPRSDERVEEAPSRLDDHDRWAEGCTYRTSGWVGGSHVCKPCERDQLGTTDSDEAARGTE